MQQFYCNTSMFLPRYVLGLSISLVMGFHSHQLPIGNSLVATGESFMTTLQHVAAALVKDMVIICFLCWCWFVRNLEEIHECNFKVGFTSMQHPFQSITNVTHFLNMLQVILDCGVYLFYSYVCETMQCKHSLLEAIVRILKNCNSTHAHSKYDCSERIACILYMNHGACSFFFHPTALMHIKKQKMNLK